jgi:hypothetical protein
MVKLKARGSDGRVAIYNGSSDAPFNNPQSNIDDIKFHSDLNYPTIINTVTDSITLPSRAADGHYNVTHTLFSHGRGGYPMILAELTSPFSSTLVGSVPVYMSSGGFGRWITIGANTTHVILHEQCVTYRDTAQSSVGVTVKVHITDVLL